MIPVRRETDGHRARRLPFLFLLLWVGAAAVGLSAAGAETPAWRLLEPGLELGDFLSPTASEIGDSRVKVLRIDPAVFALRLLNASAEDSAVSKTAKEWCFARGLTAAINASMFQADRLTSVSLMKTAGHVNNAYVSKDKTFLVFDRLDPSLPEARLIDRECDDIGAFEGLYATFVQSIRMISCKGKNIWTQQPRKWSAAALGTDATGRVLFIHVRSPYSMHDLIDALQRLPLGLERAMYLEGGPEAQLYVRSGSQEWEFVGGYETAFFETTLNTAAWPVPNAIGIVRK